MSINDKSNPQSKSEIFAYFDFDDTLTSGDSILYWHRFYFRERKKRFFLRLFHFIGFLLWSIRTIKSGTLKRIMLAPLCYETPQERERLAEKFAREELPKYFYPSMLDRLWSHKNLGHKVAILSASPMFYLKHLDKIINVDAIIGTRIEFPSKGLIRIPRYRNKNFKGKEKVVFIKSHAEFPPEGRGCYSYSDHHSDRYLLRYSEFPFCVNPNEKLRRIAQDKNWPILTPHRLKTGKNRTLASASLLLFQTGSLENKTTINGSKSHRESQVKQWCKSFAAVLKDTDFTVWDSFIQNSLLLKGLPELLMKQIVVTHNQNNNTILSLYNTSGSKFVRNPLISFTAHAPHNTNYIIRVSNPLSQWIDTESYKLHKFWIKVRHHHIGDFWDIDKKIFTNFLDKCDDQAFFTMAHFWLTQAQMFFDNDTQTYTNSEWVQRIQSIEQNDVLIPHIKLIKNKDQIELHQFSPEGIRFHKLWQYGPELCPIIPPKVTDLFLSLLAQDFILDIDCGFNLKLINQKGISLLKVIDYAFMFEAPYKSGSAFKSALEINDNALMDEVPFPNEWKKQLETTGHDYTKLMTDLLGDITIVDGEFDFSQWKYKKSLIDDKKWQLLYQLPHELFTLIKSMWSIETLFTLLKQRT